jgi:hypothetical protein
MIEKFRVGNGTHTIGQRGAQCTERQSADPFSGLRLLSRSRLPTHAVRPTAAGLLTRRWRRHFWRPQLAASFIDTPHAHGKLALASAGFFLEWPVLDRRVAYSGQYPLAEHWPAPFWNEGTSRLLADWLRARVAPAAQDSGETTPIERAKGSDRSLWFLGSMASNCLTLRQNGTAIAPKFLNLAQLFCATTTCDVPKCHVPKLLTALTGSPVRAVSVGGFVIFCSVLVLFIPGRVNLAHPLGNGEPGARKKGAAKALPNSPQAQDANCLVGLPRSVMFSYLIALDTSPKVSLSSVPRPRTTAMIATAMPAAIRPYSMAVAAFSSRPKRLIHSPIVHS